MSVPHIPLPVRLLGHQDVSAQDGLMPLCHSCTYCFSEKGFNSHFIETDSAIHHSQVCAHALFKQCRCIIAQGLKEWALHTSQLPTFHLVLFLSLFLSFLGKNEAVSSVFPSARAPALCSRSAQGRGWNWIKHDWHLVIWERERERMGLRMGKEIENLTSAYLSVWTVRGGCKCIRANRGNLNLYFRLCQCLVWNDFRLQ